MTPRAPRRHTLSVCMICKDEADRIEPALQSVAGWADEVIVFDSGSTDGTLEILARYPVTLTRTDWPGYGPQRQRSLAAARGEYVLTLDADERVSPELKAEIDAELSKDTVPCAVYRMPWAPVILGRVLQHGGRYGSPQARLFRREGAAFPDKQVHETLIPPPGPWGRFKGKLVHDSYRGYRHMVDKHNKYAFLLAEDKFRRGARTTLLAPPLRWLWEFLLQYFGRGLMLDGGRGLLLAWVLAGYAAQKYLALWALQQQERRSASHDARH